MADLQIIRVDDARALVQVGVPDSERAHSQEVRVSVALGLGSPPAFGDGHDRISATIDYADIIAFVREGLCGPTQLIETLADRVAAYCLSLSARAHWVEVTVKKPSVLAGDGMVAVTIRRERA